jgi:hypothetical protein
LQIHLLTFSVGNAFRQFRLSALLPEQKTNHGKAKDRE